MKSLKGGESYATRNEDGDVATRAIDPIFQLKLRLIVKLWIQMNCNCAFTAHAIIDPIWNICITDIIQLFEKKKERRIHECWTPLKARSNHYTPRDSYNTLLYIYISDCSVNEIPITRFFEWPPLSGVIPPRTGTELFYNRPFLPCSLTYPIRENMSARPLTIL